MMLVVSVRRAHLEGVRTGLFGDYEVGRVGEHFDWLGTANLLSHAFVLAWT